MKRILLMGLSAMSVALLVCAVETTEQAAKELKPDRNMERAAHDLAQNLPVPVELLDLANVFDLSRTPELKSPENQARYFVALGAALRGAGTKP